MSSALAASKTSARKTKSDSLSFKDFFLPGSETKVARKLQQNLHLQTACFLCKISRSRATIPVSRHYNREVSTADSTIQPRYKNSRPLAPIFLQPRTRSNTIPRLLLLLLAKVCFCCTQKQFLQAIWTIPQTERENLNAKLEIGVSIIRGRLRTREKEKVRTHERSKTGCKWFNCINKFKPSTTKSSLPYNKGAKSLHQIIETTRGVPEIHKNHKTVKCSESGVPSGGISSHKSEQRKREPRAVDFFYAKIRKQSGNQTTPQKNRQNKIGALIKERRGVRITYRVQISTKTLLRTKQSSQTPGSSSSSSLQQETTILHTRKLTRHPKTNPRKLNT